MEIEIVDLIGFAGMGFILLAYFLLQKNTYNSFDRNYLLMNLLGSLLLLISLYFKPNPAAIILQIIWIAISVYGLCKGKSSSTPRK